MTKHHFHMVKAYFKFLWKSTNQHGIHSPFVFELLTKCFYDTSQLPEYDLLAKHRKQLFSDNTVIAVTDFGAGSKVFRSNERPVNKIASTAGISERRAKLLLRLVKYFAPEKILEIGTSVGLATAALSLARPEAKVVSLEGCPATAAVAKNGLTSLGIQNTEIRVVEFGKFFSSSDLQSGHQLIYFDGNHSRAATISYFHAMLPDAQNNDVWIFDDIHWSEEMELAWEQIKADPNVTVTIDTFQWGLVFFRKEQRKEDFVVRV